MIVSVEGKERLTRTSVIPRPKAVGISWQIVRFRSAYREIATPWRARNDSDPVSQTFCIDIFDAGRGEGAKRSVPNSDRPTMTFDVFLYTRFCINVKPCSALCNISGVYVAIIHKTPGACLKLYGQKGVSLQRA